MAMNGRRLPALDNSPQFNSAQMSTIFPVDASAATEPAIHPEHKLGRRLVKLDDLTATQTNYNPQKVRAMLASSKRPKLPEVVFASDGRQLIHDGHHRAVTAKKSGKATMYVQAYQG
jgi:hypothetical protein